MNRHALRPAVHRDQAVIVARADRAATAVDRVVAAVWSELLQVLRDANPHNWLTTYARIAHLLAGLGQRLQRELHADLVELAKSASRRTVGDLKKLAGGEAREAETLPDPLVPGIDVMQLVRIGAAVLPREIVFEAPSERDLLSIVHRGDWWNRIAALTKLADPGAVASAVVAGYADGKTQQQIARDIRPLLQGVQSSARRVARTEGVRIGHEMQMAGWDQLGDAVIGYQIHSARRTNSRPWHVKRDKTIYYKDPRPGQKGLYQMPRPPLEAPDPAERPAGAPQVASDCLCFLTPVLAG